MTQQRQHQEGSPSPKFRGLRQFCAPRRCLLSLLAWSLFGDAVVDSPLIEATTVATTWGHDTPLPLFAGILVPGLRQRRAKDELKNDVLAAEEAGLFETLATETGSSLRDRILRLGLRRDRFARTQLLEIAASEPLEGDDRARLSLALALSRHLHGDERSDVLRALVRILNSGHRPSISDDPMTFRADATVALILAHSGAPDGLAFLLAHAAAPDQSERLTPIARLALRIHPPATPELLALPPIISPRTARFGWEAAQRDSSTVPREKKRLAELTVAQLLSAYDERRISETLSSLARSPEQLPRGLLSKDEWKRALATRKAAALRILAILSETAAPSLRRFTLRYAAAELTVSDPTLRSAAVWAYSALRAPSDTKPSDTKPSDTKSHPTWTAALHLGQLPFSCRAVLEAKLPAGWSDPLALERCVLPPSRVSTTELWNLQEEHFLPVVFQLAARFSDRAKAWRSPSVAQLRDWLSSKDLHTRAAAAKGMGSSGAGSAIGLLRAAYLDESSPEVRRAIVQALYRLNAVRPRSTNATEELPDPILGFAASFDPDAACRSFAVGGADPERNGFVAVQGARGEVKVTSRLGVEYTGHAAPDGFFGLVDDEF